MSKFCKVLKEGMKDETSADKYYEKLSTVLREQVQEEYGSGQELRRDLDIISHIRDDEQDHKVALTALYNRRCK